MPPLSRMLRQLYLRLMRFYPSGFRAEFEDEMARCFDELVQEAWQQSQRRGLIVACFWVCADIVQSVIEQWRLEWRETMNNNPYGKTLLASTAIFLMAGVILFSYGSYNLVLHPGSYLRKPAVLFTWRFHERQKYSEFVVSRVKKPTGIELCEEIPINQFQVIPQTNLRSQYFSTSSGSILPAESHKIRDSYGVNRSNTHCYHVSGLEADGSLTPLSVHYWGPYNQSGEFVLGNSVALLSGFLLLFLGLRLGLITWQLRMPQPSM